MPNIIKPFHLGMLHRTLAAGGRHYLVISAFGLFDFDETADLQLEQELWPLVQAQLPEGAVFDVGMPKGRAEVLLGGSGVSARRKPVEALPLSLRLANIDKRAVAVGPRFWRETAVGGPQMTAALRFVECPLDYSVAFGGADFTHNPSGHGHGSRALLQRGEAAPLPRLMRPEEPIRNVDDTRAPVAFGALGYEWPQRSQYGGSYDATWLKERWPGYPDDMRWELFNQAADDQWLDEHPRGDERFTLGGMNADEPLLRGHLPGVLTRAFIKRADAAETPLQEVPMRLDTVWLFGCVKRGVVVFRGMTRVQDSDALDVSDILLGWEKLGDPRRTPQHYEEVFRLRTDPERGVEYALMDSQLGPIVSPEELARRQQARLALARADDEAFDRMVALQLERAKAQGPAEDWQRFEAALADTTAQGQGRTALPADPLGLPSQPPAALVPAVTPDDIRRMDIDVPAIRQALDAVKQEAGRQAAEARSRGEEQQREADARLASLQLDAGGGREAAQRARAERLVAPEPPSPLAVLASGDDLDAFHKTLAGLAIDDGARGALDDSLQQGQAQLAEGLHSARLLATEPLEEQRWEPAVARYFGSLIVEALAAGRDLRGRDLAGADLRGADLSHRDLRGCMLERADLRGANLSGSRLDEGCLTAANLLGATLTDATLCGANLCAADAREADLRGVDLSRARMLQIDLRGARLSGARLDEVVALNARLGGAALDGAQLIKATLLQAELSSALLDGADLSGAVLLEATLTGASLRGATLTDAVLASVQADDCDFDDARIERMFGHGGSFVRARFRRVRGAGVSFRTANLTRADFEEATLNEADLGEASMRHANLQRASLRRALMMGVDLQDADLRKADLLEAMLRKARLDRTNLSGASLFNAHTDEASFRDARLDGAKKGNARIRAAAP